MINIVLVEPEIPQNTGNIARTCACTGSKLHIVKPMGFEINDKHLKRAGLDYWDDLGIEYYENLDDFLEKHREDKMYFLTTKAKKSYSQIDFEDNCYLIFGKETKGLPESLILENMDNCLRIPMKDKLRSLNLSNSVAIVIYEALRQNDFFDLNEISSYFEDN